MSLKHTSQSPNWERYEVTLAAGRGTFNHNLTTIEQWKVVPQYTSEPLFDEADAGTVVAATGIDSGGFTTVPDGFITDVRATVGTHGVDGATVGTYCREDDGAVFTDADAAFLSATVNDVEILPAVPAQNDALYIGIDDILFNKVRNMVAGTDGVVTTNDLKYEYYNGATWEDLTIVHDTTNGLTDLSVGTEIMWEIPTDWGEVAINTVTCFWIRIRENHALPVYGTVPLFSQGSLGIDAVIDVHFNTTTVFTTQKNRITLYESGLGRTAHVTGAIEVPLFTDALDYTVDVDLVATGTAPQDLLVEVFGYYSGAADAVPEQFVLSNASGRATITSSVALSDAVVDVYVMGT